MKIVISGATGFIGKAFSEALLKQGHSLTVLTRSPKQTQNPKLSFVVWNPDDEKTIVKEIDGTDAVVNLAGEPIIGKRWSANQKEKLLTSRVNATKIITHSIEKAKIKPKVFVNASAIGYYGSRGNEELTENSHSGEDFLAKVCKAWEAHAVRAKDFGVRVVCLRIGVVLGKNGGALEKMLPPFKLFAGGWLGNGNQWMSWIHIEDLVRLISFCIENPKAEGPVNGVSPAPVTNKAFSMVLAQTLKRPCFMPVPEVALKLLLGEASIILLGSARVLPRKARELSFTFYHPDIRNALAAILR